jgi:hypothetical protein
MREPLIVGGVLQPEAISPAVAVTLTRCDRYSMEHTRTITQIGEGTVQAICSCGWRGEVFGTDKTGGVMDPLQQASEVADLHEWESDLRT